MFLTYDGIELEVESFQRFDQVAIYTDDGVDYQYTEFTISVRSLWHPDATSDGGTTAPESMDSLRRRLLSPRKQLVVSVPFGGDIDSRVVLRSPLKDPDGNAYFCDAHDGPQPVSLNIQQIVGEETMIVDYTIKTWINECPGTNGSPVSPVLSHRWAMSHTMDKQNGWKTKRVIAGKATFRSDLLYDRTGKKIRNPDDFRTYFFHNLPPNYIRENVQVNANSNGTELEYIIEDTQVDAVLDSTARKIAEISHIEGTYQEVVEAAKFNVSSLPGLGRDMAMAGTSSASARRWAGVVGVFGIIQDLFPTSTYQLDVRVVGTRRATRAGLVQVALRTAAAFRLGSYGRTSDSLITRMFLALVDNFLMSAAITVGIVDKFVELRLTYSANAMTSALLNIAGLIATGPEAGVPVNFIRQTLGPSAPPDLINTFRVGIINASTLRPISARNVPESIPGVTIADVNSSVYAGGPLASWGPRGGTESFGGEKHSRGSALSHLVTQVLTTPCSRPGVPARADGSYDKPGGKNIERK